MNSNSSAIGGDNISFQIIKAVCHRSLTHLVFQSLAIRIFPKRWKKNILHPLPKATAPKVNLFSDLFHTKDKEDWSILVLLEYSQAFNSIYHKLLLAKRNHHGFGAGAVEWVQSHLVPRCTLTSGQLLEAYTFQHAEELYRFRGLLPEPLKLQLMQSLKLSNSKIPKHYLDDCVLSEADDYVSQYRDDINTLCMGDFCKLLTNCMTHKVLLLREP
ncbi:hypothetical protein J6590_087338, partial [Homalodisca vitripennis]